MNEGGGVKNKNQNVILKFPPINNNWRKKVSDTYGLTKILHEKKLKEEKIKKQKEEIKRRNKKKDKATET